MSLSVLNDAKNKLLNGEFHLATSYYNRAITEGVEPCAVNLRYLTKEYLVYPLEYDHSIRYFELLEELMRIAKQNSEYESEYQLAAASLFDIKRLFLRSLSLFYFSDILVSSSDSVVLREITEIHRYIKENKENLLEKDVFCLKEYVHNFNKKKFARDINIIEAYCMNILLSYAAEQHSVYQGKRYTATTLDYGYFYCTTVNESDRYYHYANIKPRLFLLGYEAYYHDFHKVYKEKLKEIGHFDSPKELRKELIYYTSHKDKKDNSAKDFLKYAKHFEKNDASRQSWFGDLKKISSTINPLLKLNPFNSILNKNIGSFELNAYFPQKKVWGVCSMLAAGKGWKVDTVRWVMIVSACLFVGLFAYVALAIAMKLGFYIGVTIEKP
ncbi:MAG: PspC domain-containing protein [Clostridia bacterium]|nr:PspC domain-containing protein [Clostridia bacterium]